MPPALARATYVGHHDPTSMLDVTVALKLRNTEQLNEFLQAVQDPTSSEYHRFLTPQQFNSMYGPTLAQTAAVVAYLKSQGLTVTDVTPDGRLIRIRDESGNIEKALAVLINDYAYHGRNVYGTMDNPQFPGRIADAIQAVLGLSNIVRFHPMNIMRPVVSFSSSSPVGYSPLQIATAYDWPSLTDTVYGSGVTIAVATFNSSALAASDYDTFWNYYGLPTHTVTVHTVDTPGNVNIDDQEATMDVEYSGAMAPGAAIEVYDGENDTFAHILDVYERIVDDHTAQVMTTSFGTAEENMPSPPAQDSWQVFDGYFENAAGVGITVVAADGDNGSSDGTSNSDEADYPSSDPYVVAAGGATLTLNGNNTIESETAWSYAYYPSYDKYLGTGGAQSQLFIPEPSWQVGNGVPENGVRNTSDIALNADPNTPQTLYFESGWIGGDGTSIVAPEFAGLMADWLSLAGGATLGAADPSIYADANSSNYSTDFYDITSGSNGYFSAGSGWDHPTGWGSINAIELLTHIAGGIALSPPQNLRAEYETCSGNSEQYLVSWDVPAVGTPSGGYDAEWEEPDLGIGWENLSGSGTVRPLSGLQPKTVVNLRVRAMNGTVTTPYDTYQFTTRFCGPPPAPTGTGK